MSIDQIRALTTLCLAANGSRPPTGQRELRQLQADFYGASCEERTEMLFALLLDIMRKISYMHLGSYDTAAAASDSGFRSRAVMADMIKAHEDSIVAAGREWRSVSTALVELIATDLRTVEIEERRQELLNSFIR